MFKTLKDAWKIAEIRNKLLFTLFIIVLYRLGANIPVPYVAPDVVNSFNEQTTGSIFQYLNILSGDAFGKATLFALSVSPYITSSIVVQLLTVAIPPLERWSKDEAGKKKITALTRWITVALALITAYGYTMLLANYGWLTFTAADTHRWFKYIVMILCYCAGAALIMWMAERIDERGIGNGISMILFANIVARIPSYINTFKNIIVNDKYHWAIGILIAIAILAFVLAIVVFIVWFTNSERRIPIQYAKRVVGNKMYGGQGTNLPLKLNMSGVMPIIFASSIVSILPTIAGFISNEENGFKKFVDSFLSYDSWIYLIIYIVLTIAFGYFYIMISFNPVEVANNIKNQGGSIPGIRPGRPTVLYIKKILNRITLIGSLFLCIVSGIPMLVNIIGSMVGSTTFSALAFSGSSLLIVIGVALETFRDIEAQLTMRNYKGFLD